MTGELLVTGATGLIGGAVARAHRAGGGAVRAVSRRPPRGTPEPGVRPVVWDGRRLAPGDVAGASAVVHLAGESVFGGLPTRARRERIFASRIDSTRALVETLAALPGSERPRVLVCASAVGYYGDRGEEPLPESAPPGAGFLADVCVAWEAEAARAADLGVRVVSLRFGIVLAKEGGALAMLARVFGLGLGGRVGNGRQWTPWIALEDAARLALRALEDERLAGPVNAVAPGLVRNAELSAELARVLHRPAVLPVPAFAVRAALGPIAGELLGSKRAIPEQARAAGFEWRRPELAGALAAALA